MYKVMIYLRYKRVDCWPSLPTRCV